MENRDLIARFSVDTNFAEKFHQFTPGHCWERRLLDFR
jgi:hypothetical protein